MYPLSVSSDDDSLRQSLHPMADSSHLVMREQEKVMERNGTEVISDLGAGQDLGARETMTRVDRLEGLLRVSKAISFPCDPGDGEASLARELQAIVDFDYLFISNCGEDSSEAKPILEVSGQKCQPAEVGFPLQDSTVRWVHESRQSLRIANWDQETRFPRMKEFLAEIGVASTCTLPLARFDRRLGVLEFGSLRPNAYSDEESAFLSVVADQLALALDSAVSFVSSQVAETRLKLLLELTNSIVSNLEFHDLLEAISATVRRVMQCHGVGVMLPEADGKNLRVFALDAPEGSALRVDSQRLISIAGTPSGRAFQSGTAALENPFDSVAEADEQQLAVIREGVKSVCFLPLLSHGRKLGLLALGSREENGFDKDDLKFLQQVANQVAFAVENALAYGEIAELKNKLTHGKLYLENEMRGEMDFEGIVGQSSALRQVLRLVETVAPSDSTVLLLGETGTGKELIARAIHDRSRRKDRTFVKLNCAAIPTGLLESELFGHERGAFTGAITQKTGRLELADQGPLFLDEIGDIPLELQPKLLRVLQEREFERLGSTRTKKGDGC